MNGRRLTLSCLLILLGASQLGAQELSSGFNRPRYMIYLFEAEENTLTAEQSFMLYNSILAAVAQANKDVVIMESPDQGIPRTKEAKEELARRISADCWLAVTASGGFQNLTVQADTFDILRQADTGSALIRPGFVVDFRTIARGFWDEIVAGIRDRYVRVVDLTTLTVRGRQGTEVIGVPGGPYTIGGTGVLEQKIPYPSVFTLTAKSFGTYDVEMPLSLGLDPLTIDLDQMDKPWFGAELRLSSLQFPELRVWFSILPATLFIRLGFSTQLIGMFLIDNTSSVLVTGSPLSFVGMDAGIYLLPAEWLFRVFVCAGGYLRISHPAGYFGLDFDAAPGAVTLVLGGEYSPSRRVRFVFTYEPAFILAADPQRYINLSFIPNSFPSGQVPGYWTLPWGILDLRNFYIGVRLDFESLRRSGRLRLGQNLVHRREDGAQLGVILCRGDLELQQLPARLDGGLADHVRKDVRRVCQRRGRARALDFRVQGVDPVSDVGEQLLHGIRTQELVQLLAGCGDGVRGIGRPRGLLLRHIGCKYFSGFRDLIFRRIEGVNAPVQFLAGGARPRGQCIQLLDPVRLRRVRRRLCLRSLSGQRARVLREGLVQGLLGRLALIRHRFLHRCFHQGGRCRFHFRDGIQEHSVDFQAGFGVLCRRGLHGKPSDFIHEDRFFRQRRPGFFSRHRHTVRKPPGQLGQEERLRAQPVRQAGDGPDAVLRHVVLQGLDLGQGRGRITGGHGFPDAVHLAVDLVGGGERLFLAAVELRKILPRFLQACRVLGAQVLHDLGLLLQLPGQRLFFLPVVRDHLLLFFLQQLDAHRIFRAQLVDVRLELGALRIQLFLELRKLLVVVSLAFRFELLQALVNLGLPDARFRKACALGIKLLLEKLLELILFLLEPVREGLLQFRLTALQLPQLDPDLFDLFLLGAQGLAGFQLELPDQPSLYAGILGGLGLDGAFVPAEELPQAEDGGGNARNGGNVNDNGQKQAAARGFQGELGGFHRDAVLAPDGLHLRPDFLPLAFRDSRIRVQGGEISLRSFHGNACIIH